MRLPLWLLVVTVLSLGVLTACNSTERTAHTASGAAPPIAAPVNGDGVRRVTVAELKDLLAKNEAVVIDVRNQASYDAGHIRGSKLIPEAEVVNHLDELPKNKLIVTYCS